MKKRSCYCGELRLNHEGKEVVLQGWVKTVRDYGGCVFIDLRDREGVAQVVFRPEAVDAGLMKAAGSLKSEHVVEIEGKVASRGENVNPKMPTGQVEVIGSAITVLAEAQTPPFPVEDEINALETTRLAHRYLDLRRPAIAKNFVFRSRALKVARDYFAGSGFLEIETPFLTKSTPEGARDYLVPSRIEPGKFYALPQSPQLFKQLFMVAGFDRTMQIVRCFRDEDLRADRQPEFTQIDVEMSFVEPEDVMGIIDGLLNVMMKGLLGVDLEKPGRITYDEAIGRYGVDNPDVRFGMELVDLTDAVRGGGMNVIDAALEGGAEAVGIKVENATFSRKDVDGLTEVARTYGARGLFWLKRGEGGDWGGSAKKLSAGALEAVGRAAEAKENDLVLFVVDKKKTARTSVGRLRVEVGRRTGLIPLEKFGAVWVRDFPMFEWDEEEKRFAAMHHPFTSPREEDLELLESDPGRMKAKAYDIVLNGQEIGGGSIRIHGSDVQKKVFSALGLSDAEAKEKFGFLLQALGYGAPPHGGIALVFDRLVALLLGSDNIR
ncbi:MAG: aspartate--tRNA ligase, partial [Pseudomonadota bacterium]